MERNEPRRDGVESQNENARAPGAERVRAQGGDVTVGNDSPPAGGLTAGSDLVGAGDLIGADDLIAGISADAKAEAERLLEEARKAARDRLQAAEAQGARILDEARAKADAQSRTVGAQALSTMRMENKRAALKVREEALRRVLQAARDKLAALAAAPGGTKKETGGSGGAGGEAGSVEYRKVLLGWIVEAAIGLNVPAATVNTSAQERKLIDRDLLREAERTVKELTGRKVALKLEQGDPLVGQGVVLRSADGRLEFNNQVSTRLLRHQSEIRKIVFEALDR